MGIIKLIDGYEHHKNKFFKNDDTKKIPINIVKEYLQYFNISLDDISKLVRFSEEQEKMKQFVHFNKNKFETLTDKEKQVFTLVVNGKKTSEIAKLLFVESSTVSSHRKKIKQKLDLDSIFDWYQYAKAFELLKF